MSGTITEGGLEVNCWVLIKLCHEVMHRKYVEQFVGDNKVATLKTMYDIQYILARYLGYGALKGSLNEF